MRKFTIHHGSTQHFADFRPGVLLRRLMACITLKIRDRFMLKIDKNTPLHREFLNSSIQLILEKLTQAEISIIEATNMIQILIEDDYKCRTLTFHLN